MVENGESSAQYGNNYYRLGHFARPVLCRAYLAYLGLVIDLGISTALALPRLRQNLSGVNEDVHPQDTSQLNRGLANAILPLKKCPTNPLTETKHY